MADHYGNCYWCQRVLLAPERLAHSSLTRDHIWPKSKGGRKTVKSCRKCNHLKGDLLPAQWHKLRRQYPNYRKLFQTHADVLAAIAHSRRELLAPLRIARIQPRWPDGVFVALPPLCRGLPGPVFHGRNV